ncbi:MAG: glycosyltransferase family 4 protein [Acidimicrobiia bacterium]|nr:glycosyltransferase family 4 protein [Acidimicrobiia bacterium]
MRRRPLVLHVTTVDVSLTLLLGPQLRAFRDAGYEIVTASAPGPATSELADWGIAHHPLRHATRAMRPLEDLRLAAEIRTLVRRLRPDIVHTHNPKPGWFGRPAARLGGAAVVNTVHGIYATPDDRLAKRVVVYGLERLSAAFGRVDLVQNPEDLAVLHALRYRQDRVALLGNGVDLSRFDPSAVDPDARTRLRAGWKVSDTDVVCGVVSRLVWEKGIAELLEAAGRLRPTHPQLRFVVVGPTDPDKHDAVDPATIARAEADGVRFLGMRADIEELYTAFDLYALASWREGFPRSAMEAAAMGLAVVATDIRGCRQVVDDGATGRLVPPRDPTALTAAIGSLAADDGLRRTMGHAGRRKAVAEFDDRRCVEVTLDAYAEILGRRPVNRR